MICDEWNRIDIRRSVKIHPANVLFFLNKPKFNSDHYEIRLYTRSTICRNFFYLNFGAVVVVVYN